MIFYFNKKQLRVVNEDKKVWLCAKDLADILGLSQGSVIVSRIIPTQNKTHINTLNTVGSNQQMQYVDKEGLTYFTERSTIKNLPDFANWMMTTVLSQEIRISSTKIAELMGRQHLTILRDIRVYIDRLGPLSKDLFELSSYLDKQNKTQPCYIIKGTAGLLQISPVKSKKAKAEWIIKVNELVNGYIPEPMESVKRSTIKPKAIKVFSFWTFIKRLFGYEN